MKSVLSSILFITLLASCSSKYGISNAQAFVRKAVAGTIRVDDNGRPMKSGVSEQRLIFIETDTSKPLPVLTTVWVRQRPFAVRLAEMKQPYYPVGKTVQGEEVTLTPKEGHKLWQLVLMPPQDTTVSDAGLQAKIQQNVVVLKGKWKEKDFSYGIAKEEQLETVSYQ